jgi:hypothetical protein
MEFGSPPDVTDKFKEYLLAQLRKLDIRLGKAEVVTGCTRVPQAPIKGGLYFFPVAIPNAGISSPGLYTFDGTGWVPAGGASAAHGVFKDGNTQTIFSTTNSVTLAFDATIAASGISIVNSDRITFAEAGTYNLQLNAQAYNSNSQDQTCNIWLRKGTVDVPGSNRQTTLVGGGYLSLTWDASVSVSAGQYAQIVFSASNTGVSLSALGSGVSPARPTAFSVLLTVTRVG